MLRSPRHLGAPLFAVVATLLTACSEEPPVSGLLDQVPADTPYVFASSKPLPGPLYDRLMSMSAAQMDDAVRQWQTVAQEFARRRAQASPDVPPAELPVEAGVRVMNALVGELQGHMDARGMAELGFARDAKSVGYGLGLFPVLRTEIADPAKVEALLARVEQRSETVAPRARLGQQEYRRIPLGPDMALVVAVTERQLVVTLLPTAAEDRLLPLALGQQRPAASLADAGTLAKLQARYGFAGYGDGYVDVRRLVRILTGRGQGLDTTLHDVSGELPQPSPACLGLLDKLVDGAPRVVMGMTDVQDDGYELAAVTETAPAVSSHLQQLAHPRPLPGMGTEGDAMISMGLDVDLPALREGLKALLRYVAEQGGQCAWVDSQRILAGLPQIDLMLGPMLGGLNGVYAELSDLRIDEQTLKPVAVSGGVLVAVPDPRGLVGMAAILNPALAQLQLPLDGSAVAVPAELLPPDVPSLHLAASDGLLAVATGPDSASRAQAMLKARRSDTPMLLGASYDMARFMGVMARVMGVAAERLEAAGQVEQAQLVRERAGGFDAAAGGLDRLELSIAPDAAGLMMRQRVRFK